jgi:flagellar hook-length control protein FliK
LIIQGDFYSRLGGEQQGSGQVQSQNSILDQSFRQRLDEALRLADTYFSTSESQLRDSYYSNLDLTREDYSYIDLYSDTPVKTQPDYAMSDEVVYHDHQTGESEQLRSYSEEPSEDSISDSEKVESREDLANANKKINQEQGTVVNPKLSTLHGDKENVKQLGDENTGSQSLKKEKILKSSRYLEAQSEQVSENAKKNYLSKNKNAISDSDELNQLDSTLDKKKLHPKKERLAKPGTDQGSVEVLKNQHTLVKSNSSAIQNDIQDETTNLEQIDLASDIQTKKGIEQPALESKTTLTSSSSVVLNSSKDFVPAQLNQKIQVEDRRVGSRNQHSRVGRLNLELNSSTRNASVIQDISSELRNRFTNLSETNQNIHTKNRSDATLDLSSLLENDTSAGSEALSRFAGRSAGTTVFQGRAIGLSQYQQMRGLISDEVLKQAKFIIQNESKGEVRLMLKPAALGLVRIRMDMMENTVALKLFVENAEVKELLQSAMSEFKEGFIDQGYDASQVEVFVGDKNNSGEGRKEQEQTEAKVKPLKVNSFEAQTKTVRGYIKQGDTVDFTA